MKLLDENDSWDLLSKTLFGEKGCCPSAFQEIGKKICKSCKGLPLSIVVVGGLLAKSNQSIEYWENMVENLNAIVNLDDGERCLKTLYMSYKQLPVHLKPCFLYMGIYHEDHVIRISNIVELWVSEGFIKPTSENSLEDVAREYLKELIGRNLIMIHKLGKIGRVKECKVHDLIRDLCLREARKEGFYTVYPGHKIKGHRVNRIVISGTIREIEEVEPLSSAAPLARSWFLTLDYKELLPDHVFRLLRIVGWNILPDEFLNKLQQFVNSRTITFTISEGEFPSTICRFWNLQILTFGYAQYGYITAPTDIWHMSHIRHMDFGGQISAPTDIWHMSHIRHTHFCLPDPPPNVEDGIVLGNLQSLVGLNDFRCSEQMVRTIPNIRKLRVYFSYTRGVDERNCLTNLDCFDKLESLNCSFERPMTWPINYPLSLTKLYVGAYTSQCWEDYGLDKIGALPLLQKLTLHSGTFKEGKWETSEGQFRSLKYLFLEWCNGLQVWTSEASQFPRLEHLRLEVSDMGEIPLDFAEIPTLRLIKLEDCSDSAIESSKRILEEQEALYGEEETTLQVQVKLLRDNNRALSSLASPNFHVTPFFYEPADVLNDASSQKNCIQS